MNDRLSREARKIAKSLLTRATTGGAEPAAGATLLIYHRVGGGSGDELDLPEPAFVAQMDTLLTGGHDVVHMDAALDRLAAGDARPSVVLTFDDGFADVARVAFPHLVERALPFTLYFAAGLAGRSMRWEGSTGRSQGEPALAWDAVGELVASGLCTIGNHTWDHPAPDHVDARSLDRCSDAIEARLGLRPAHFAWTWGIPVPTLMPAVRERFRSAATGSLGRNLPGADLHALARVPVRATDPLPFFRAKLHGNLLAERTYDTIVRAAKAARGGSAAIRPGRSQRG